MAKGRASKSSARPAGRRPAPAPRGKGLSDDEDSDASTGLQRRDDLDESDADEAVFDLAGSDGSSDGSEASDDESDDEDDSEPESETEIDRLVNNLPSSMRQRILRGDAGAEDSLSEGSDGEEEAEEGWGRKKKTYWAGDTADLEIGQDVQDAEDEEEAAMELDRARSSGLDISDYYEGMDAPEIDRGGKARDAGKGKKGKKDTFKPDRLQKALELAAGVSDSVSLKGSVEVENIPRDIKSLSKDQRLALLAVDTPELPALAEELAERIGELQQKINPARDLVRQVQSAHGQDACADEIVQYLEVKQQMLLSYCTNLTFYMLLKSQGKSVRSHPVMRQLLELRYAMEKLRPLDGKLQYQIDRLVKMAASGEGVEEALSAAARNRPNPFNLAARDGGDSSEEEEQDNYGSREVKDDGIYRPPRMQAVMYNENEKQLDKAKEKLKSKRQKLKNSEIMESLREEFGVAPEQASSAGTGLDTADVRLLREEEEERRAFEEERFVRLTMSRKDKKDIRKRERESAQALNNITDIGDIGEFEELNDLSSKYLEKSAEVDGLPSKGKRAAGSSAARKALSERDTGSALQRAVSAFSFGGDGGFDGDDVEDVFADTSAKRKKARPAPSYEEGEDDDDFGAAAGGDEDYYGEQPGMDEFDRMLAAGDESSGKRRRPAPTDYGDEEDDMLEAFASKKKDFMKKKKDFYTAPVRVGGREEVVADGQKRGISYEIMANKGLMPHRKKANRNPRVKKREMYAKAIIARKGQVREVVAGAAGAYGGEKTGIKANVSRSRKINT